MGGCSDSAASALSSAPRCAIRLLTRSLSLIRSSHHALISCAWCSLGPTRNAAHRAYTSPSARAHSLHPSCLRSVQVSRGASATSEHSHGPPPSALCSPPRGELVILRCIVSTPEGKRSPHSPRARCSTQEQKATSSRHHSRRRSARTSPTVISGKIPALHLTFRDAGSSRAHRGAGGAARFRPKSVRRGIRGNSQARGARKPRARGGGPRHTSIARLHTRRWPLTTSQRCARDRESRHAEHLQRHEKESARISISRVGRISNLMARAAEEANKADRDRVLEEAMFGQLPESERADAEKRQARLVKDFPNVFTAELPALAELKKDPSDKGVEIVLKEGAQPKGRYGPLHVAGRHGEGGRDAAGIAAEGLHSVVSLAVRRADVPQQIGRREAHAERLSRTERIHAAC